jgi:hypothetical protein
VPILPVAFEFTINGQQLTSDGLTFSYYDQVRCSASGVR